MHQALSSLPRTPISLANHVRGLPTLGMAVAYAGWAVPSGEGADSTVEAATVALVSSVMVASGWTGSGDDDTRLLADALDRLGEAARESVRARALNHVRGIQPFPEEADSEALTHALLGIVSRVRNSGVPGADALGEVISRLSDPGEAGVRNAAVALAVSLPCHLRASIDERGTHRRRIPVAPVRREAEILHRLVRRLS